jgi:soluble P-type ATPase
MRSDNFFVYNVLSVMAGSLHVDKLKLMQALYTGGNIATAIGNGTNDTTSLLHKLSKEMNVRRSEKVNIFGYI